MSAAAIWEIAMKASLGRLRISSADVKRMPHFIAAAGLDELPVLTRHATGVHG